MVRQMKDGQRTSSACYACRYLASDKSRSCCGRQRVIMKPLWHAFLFASFLSFAISFPSDQVTITKTQRKENVGSRSPFHRISEAPTPHHRFLPDVFVLSLSPTSPSNWPDLDREATENNRKTTRKSNKITVQAIDEDGRELPLRTIEYRRRKHEWAERYTSQEGLREAFGSNRNKWWGDLDAKTARRLYKRLLFPTALSELVLELGDEIVRPEELAPLAYEARKAAKMYVRERCRVPSRVGAYLFDGFRQLRKYGKFQPNGASYEQLWIRYYEENGSYNKTDDEWEYLFGQDDYDNIGDIDDVIDEIDDAVTEDEIIKRTCQKIFEKSRSTNAAIDRYYLKEYNGTATKSGDNDIDFLTSQEGDNIIESEDKTGRIKRGKRWRKRRRKRRKDRYNDLLLKRITETLERDVRKLLEPPPSTLSTNTVYSEGDRIENNSSDRRRSNVGDVSNEGNLSSRRMTLQEYHSLRLFAKARKYSQQQQAKEDDTSKRLPGSNKRRFDSKIKTISIMPPKAIPDGKAMQDRDEN